MNIRLLRRVQRRIKKEARYFIMSHWIMGPVGLKNYVQDYNACQTAACICGWGLTLDKRVSVKTMAETIDPAWKPDSPYGIGYANEMIQLGMKAFQINEDQADRLFLLSNWPDQFLGCNDYTDFDKLPAERRAELAIARIDHFIQTQGQE